MFALGVNTITISDRTIQYIKDNFPHNKTVYVADQLGICESSVRRIAKALNIKKDEFYLHSLRNDLLKAKQEHYKKNIKNYSISIEQRNIIVGSILGDASLSLYGRSKNAYFREHGCDKLIGYRRWKCEKLSTLDFKLDLSGKLHSPSHSIYTELYKKFYNEQRVKYLSKENLLLLNHPIGLACLYMDDGSLVIDSSSGKNKKYLFPRLSLYTLCFSQYENELLQQHIYNVFGISFKLKSRPDGKQFILELNNRNGVLDFLELVKPYVLQIPCMHYKVNLHRRIIVAKQQQKEEDKEIVLRADPITSSSYSEDDEALLISMKKQGKSDNEIAQKLNRSYWGIVDKIRRLRKEGKI